MGRQHWRRQNPSLCRPRNLIPLSHQHKLVPEKAVTVIDSRCGEHFAVHKGVNRGFIMRQFDACASWWTQGPDQTLQIELAKDMGYAAARFGHVMFPENVFEPALECAELLLAGVGKVIQAAGGMLMVDPLFQRVLVKECQHRKIPVIFDEVFTGFWRLGVESAAELLCCQPDIACYAMLMTGGIVPLAATLATDSVFGSFVGDSKLNALLHGHSYSGHAMGCTAAAKSIKWFKDPKTNLNLISRGSLLRELWDVDLVQQISFHRTVQRVVALGTLFALELRAEGSNAGEGPDSKPSQLSYGSLYAKSLLQNLREDGIYMRPLGNVIYLMCGPCTSPLICRQILDKLYRRLEEFSEAKGNFKSKGL